jgi:hypothetical protein
MCSLWISSDTPTTVAMAQTPHRFSQIQDFGKDAVIVPRNTSERRQHIPVAIAGTDAIISDQAFAVYDAKMFVFSLRSSRLHYIWFITVAGRLKDDPRYSNTLVYNTFPCPPISGAQSVALEEHALSILEEREKHPGKSISWLYDPCTMPTNLLDAHHALDEALEKIYIGRSFKGDTERLEHLFRRYAEMTAEKEKEVANA